MDDVYDGAGPDGLQVFEEGASVSPVGVGRVDALCGEVIELLKIGVEDDFFLVGVFEGLAARDGALSVTGRTDGGAAAETSDISTQDIHQHRLCHVVCIVTCSINKTNIILPLSLGKYFIYLNKKKVWRAKLAEKIKIKKEK